MNAIRRRCPADRAAAAASAERSSGASLLASVALRLRHVVLREHRRRRPPRGRSSARAPPGSASTSGSPDQRRLGQHGVDRPVAQGRIGLRRDRRTCAPTVTPPSAPSEDASLRDRDLARSADHAEVERRLPLEPAAGAREHEHRDHADVQQRRDQEAPLAQPHPEVADGDQPPRASIGGAHDTTSRNSSAREGRTGPKATTSPAARATSSTRCGSIDGASSSTTAPSSCCEPPSPRG